MSDLELERSERGEPPPPKSGGGAPVQTFPEERSPGQGPVGTGNVVVQPGDCVSSIAAEHGVPFDSIWDDPANAKLRAIRGHPNVLLPGDRLTVVDTRAKRETAPTDRLHRFTQTSDPTFLRIRVEFRDEPLAGKPFTLTVGTQTIEGVTDSDGLIETVISPEPDTGFLRVIDDDEIHEMNLAIGHLHPVEAHTGIQQRLNSVGFFCGDVDGKIGSRTRNAIRAFQEDTGLPVDGIANAVTREKLKEEHGC